MPKLAEYLKELKRLTDWEAYLLAHSGLPGPRGNLELAHAVADLGRADDFERWAALPPEDAPENTPAVFLVFCGVLGLGELVARAVRRGEELPGSFAEVHLDALQRLASDPRWRVREAVATALQRWGDADMPGLLAEMAVWAQGNRLQQRAAAAAVCEPRLLQTPGAAEHALDLLERITATLVDAPDRKSESFKTLRQALGYCWSVAVAARPEAGKEAFARWLPNADGDVRWVMRENLGKNRLKAMDAAWVQDCLMRIS